MDSVVLVVLGWALGLLTYPIARTIDRGRQRREIEPVLLRELREVGLTLGVVYFDLAARHDILDERGVALLRRVVDSYDGPSAQIEGLQPLRQLLAKEDAELQVLVLAMQARGTTMRMVPYSLPFLEAQIHRLDLLPKSLQEELLQIHTQLEFFNGQVGFAMAQYELTFRPEVMAVNHDPIEENIADIQKLLARRAIRLLERIARVLGWN